jgi:DNA-binding winged helix-turn-helix (wHTH) protein
MSHPDNNFYGFGDFRLDAAERALYHAENLVPLTPKAIETLLVLVRHAGHIVGKEELIQAVWPDTFVEEGNLNVNIFALRKALGERTGSRVSLRRFRDAGTASWFQCSLPKGTARR